jgi:hypothetical protein
MLTLTPIIQLLTPKPADFDGLWFRKVGGAAEYAQARKEALPLPMAWVVRFADPATPIGEAAADITVAFDVVIAIENVRTRDGGETDDTLLRYRKAVNVLLLGATLPVLIKPISYKGGQMIDYTDSDLYYRDRYQLEAVLTNYLPDPAISPYTVDKTP